MQFGNPPSFAEAAGLTVVMNRCPKIEYGRLSGEIGWYGVNRRTIDNRKPAAFNKGGALAQVLAVAEPLGALWLKALQMTILPLVSALIFTGVLQAVRAASAGASRWRERCGRTRSTTTSRRAAAEITAAIRVTTR